MNNRPLNAITIEMKESTPAERERVRKKGEGECLLGVWLYDKCSKKSFTENLGEFRRARKEGGNSKGQATLHY